MPGSRAGKPWQCGGPEGRAARQKTPARGFSGTAPHSLQNQKTESRPGSPTLETSGTAGTRGDQEMRGEDAAMGEDDSGRIEWPLASEARAAAAGKDKRRKGTQKAGKRSRHKGAARRTKTGGETKEGRMPGNRSRRRGRAPRRPPAGLEGREERADQVRALRGRPRRGCGPLGTSGVDASRRPRRFRSAAESEIAEPG